MKEITSRQPPTRADVVRVVMAWLRIRPSCRPSEAQIARSLNMTERQMRLQWRKTEASGTIRDVVVEARLHFVAEQIAGGVKIEAAKRLGGFRHTTNFNNQFRRHYGCLPCDYRAHRAGCEFTKVR